MSTTTPTTGPLAGVKIVEMRALGPVPFCGMVLADLGADIVRIDRTEDVREAAGASNPVDVLGRGRRSVALDLRHPDGVRAAGKLIGSADVLLEGFRPGVMERLGLGPDVCLDANPRLVYGRMTGWGQDGPLASAAGHDINYIALAGALHPIGRAGGPPVPPLSFVGDFGGGGMLLAAGVLAALVERSSSGRGQVVDAAMVDGAALFTGLFHGLLSINRWSDQRGTNLIDSGAPFYDTYETADAKFVAVGALEPKFFAVLLDRLGLGDELGGAQRDRARWPELRHRLSTVFATRSRDEWCSLLEGTDACFAPVLGLGEVAGHPHHVQRGAFHDVGGVVQPAPAPRFGRTAAGVPRVAPAIGRDTVAVLTELGVPSADVTRLIAEGAAASATAGD